MLIFFLLKFPKRKITNFDLLSAIDEVKKSGSKQEALETAYKLVTTRYKGYRFRTYFYFWKAFEEDPNKLWKRKGFMHCTHQNYLFSILLVESGWFGENNIRISYSLVWYTSPHQYIKVKVDNKTLAIDPWNSLFGVPLGKYAKGFGYSE